MTNNYPPTTIHLIDHPAASDSTCGPRLHKVYRVLINGTEVDVAADGVKVEAASNKVTTVTLTLMPTYVIFGHSDPTIEEVP